MWTIMRSQSKIATGAIALLTAALLVAGCKQRGYCSDGSFIDLRLTSGKSPGQIEGMFRDLLAGRYESPTNGLSTYQVSNGNSRFLFLQAYNYPREIPVFSLYCYQQTRPDEWRLRGFAPVSEYYFSNGYTKTLRFEVENENVIAIYRGSSVFTVTGTKSNAAVDRVAQ